MVAVGLDDDSIRVYDASTYNLITSFTAPNTPFVVKFNGLSTHLAVGSQHSNVLVRNIAASTTTTLSTSQT